MKIRNSPWVVMTLAGMLLWGAGARADFNFLVTGVFTGGTTPGGPTFTSADGLTTVDFGNNVVPFAPPPPSTQTGLGSFTTASTATGAAPSPLTGGFTLTIEDLATLNTITFSGTLGGAISQNASTGFVVFSGPLTQVLDGVTFVILSADSGVAGRVNFGFPGLVSPSTTGTTTVNGSLSVPEPSSVLLLGLGGTAFVGLAYRRRKAERLAA
jgi:hypothetical protein